MGRIEWLMEGISANSGTNHDRINTRDLVFSHFDINCHKICLKCLVDHEDVIPVDGRS